MAAYYSLTIHCLVYVAIAFLSWRMIHHIRSQTATSVLSNSRLQQLDRQIVVVLAIQTVTPFLFYSLPAMISIATTVVPIPFSGTVSLISAATANWLSVMNPVVSLTVVRHFRETLLGWLGLGKKNKLLTATPVSGANVQVNIVPMNHSVP